MARRGTGERERLIECEAPVEEFVIRGRRVLVKRDDKVCHHLPSFHSTEVKVVLVLFAVSFILSCVTSTPSQFVSTDQRPLPRVWNIQYDCSSPSNPHDDPMT